MRHRRAAWIEDVATQKMAREAERRGDLLAARRRRVRRRAQEGRQGQEPLPPGFAGLTRDGASAPWRHKSEIVARAGERTSLEVEAETQSAQQSDLEMGEERRRALLERENIGDRTGHFAEFRMRIALRQETQQRAKMTDAMQRMAVVDQRRGARTERLDDENSELIFKARAPKRVDVISGLKRTADRSARAPAHETEMAAMRERHQFEQRRRLAMTANADDKAFVPPLHGAA